MKRILSFLLTVATILSVFPLMGTTAIAADSAVSQFQEGRASSDLRLWYDKPTNIGNTSTVGTTVDDWSRQCLPLGNGYMGAMLAGEIKTESVQYNEESLWDGGPSTSRPNYMGGNIAGKHTLLKEIQAEFLAGNDASASGKSGKLVGISAGYAPYQNFGWIDIDHTYGTAPFDSSLVSDYARDLDLNTATSSSSFMYDGIGYTREYFMSYPDDVLVMKQTATQAGKITMDITGRSPHAGAQITATDGLITTKGALPDNQMRYESQIKVMQEGGSISSAGEIVSVSGADIVYLYMSAATDYKNSYPSYRSGVDPNTVVTPIVSAATTKGYNAIYSDHLDDYQEIFGRVSLDLNGSLSGKTTNTLLSEYKQGNKSRELEILLFQYGRYLTMGSSRSGSLPSNLQGVWNHSTNPNWGSDYHMNVNLQMNYWPTYVTNMAECAIPLVDYVDSLREPGRITAKEYMGIESNAANPENGFTAHTQNTIFGFTAPGWNFDWGWSPAAVPWIIQNVWEHYEYTGDQAYLASDIYPMMKEQSVFWQQALVLNPVEDMYYSAPAYSPEHGPRTLGNVYEHVLIKQLLVDTITASEILGVDEDLRTEWQNVADKLRTEEIGESGQLKEWFDETTLGSMGGETGHRHLSHLLGLYPGDTVSIETPKLMDAAIISMNKRADNSTGWGMGQRINTWARIQDGERAYKLIDYLFKNGIYDNLFDTHPPFQIDGNFGYTSGVAEMLIQSNLGFIQPIPAIPNAWSKGSVSGLIARGNFEVDMSWSSKFLDEMTVKSNLGEECIIRYPNIANTSIVTSGGATITPSVIDDNTISFATTVGGEYKVLITDHPVYIDTMEVKSVTGALTLGASYSSMQMETVVTPANVSDKSVQWEVTNIDGSPTSIATISNIGLLTAKDKTGTVKVTATSLDPNKVSGSTTISISLGNEIIEANIDNKDLPGSAFSSGWSEWSESKHYGGSIHYKDDAENATITYNFNGTGIEVHTPLNTTFGSFEIYIDGNLEDTVPLTVADIPGSGLAQQKIFEIGGLSQGAHEIKLKGIARGTFKKAEFDYFKVITEISAVNKSTLQAVLEDAENILMDKDTSYTDESYANFKSTLSGAVAVMDNPSATDDEVDTATTDLKSSIDDLAITEVDKAVLASLLAIANEKEEAEYTPASWTPFAQAKNNAQAVYGNQTSSQTEVDDAIADLTAQMENLVEVDDPDPTVDKAALASLLTTANAKKQGDYTPASWTLFAQAKNNAQAVYDNQTSSQTEVDDAISDLTTQMENLIEVKEPTDPPIGPPVGPPVSPPKTDFGSRSSSSGSSTPDKAVFGGNQPSVGATTASPLTIWDAKAVAEKAIATSPVGAKNVTVRFIGKNKVTQNVVAELEKMATAKNLALIINFDIVEQNKVVTRVTITGKLSKAEIATTIAVAKANLTKESDLGKKFGDNAIIADFAQSGEFGGVVNVCVKLPASLQGKQLEFYRYNPLTKAYTKEQIAYKVDANQYVHFKTNNAENILIGAI